MAGYLRINLQDLLDQFGEEQVKNILSDFSCPKNPDVERFIKDSAIPFHKQGIASTYIILASYQKSYVFVGYFTLANKYICVKKSAVPSKTWQRRISKFASYDANLKSYPLSAPLIGQLGKNFANNYNQLITGDDLLYLALEKVKEMQMIVGGKVVYLECEDVPYLVDFYSQHGFVNFGKRELEKGELASTSDVKYLIQMIKYIK
jgi:hypothetical protein